MNIHKIIAFKINYNKIKYLDLYVRPWSSCILLKFLQKTLKVVDKSVIFGLIF